MTKRFAESEDRYRSFAKENKRNIVNIERTYYGVITDTIEGCFAFDMESDGYTNETNLADGTSYSEALSQMVNMEELMVKI